jgi:KDO2-lipid IV(A) lauroyltransferase
MLKNIYYLAENILAMPAYWIFGLLPFNNASSIGGFLARTFGSLLPRNELARKNLRRAFPDLDEKQVEETITGMWDNFGRSIAEFPHMNNMDKQAFAKIVEVEGVEYIEQAKQGGKGGLFISAHIANWDMVAKTCAIYDCPLGVVYRRLNNSWLDKLVQDMRECYQTEGIQKGREGSRQLIKILRRAGHVGILVDQKMNQGIAVDFFGRKAMTAPTIATLALKYKCPVIAIRVIRMEGVHFKVTIFPPMEIEKTGDRKVDVLNLMTRINKVVEDWIRDNPAQWIWVHNRWPDE